MMETKRTLTVIGIIFMVTGLLLRACSCSNQKEQSLWEKIPDEEIQNSIKEAEQEEDLGLDEPVQEHEAGDNEEAAQAAGQVTELSFEETRLLMKVAQAEAGNQGEEGMWLVMSVVLNRVNSDEWPDNIRGVIYQAHQFSTVTSGSIDDATVLTAEAHEALERIEKGNIAPQIIGFEVTGSSELDKYFERAFEYRDHRFYTAKGD